ncbi:MAG: dephospho-CoA kinase [Mariprofundaceae bacterium]|nr:dephospho-CoA kinase [Mariprofundaceae bacterium]
MPKSNRILAISGGIGSGKSTVASYLAKQGLAHLDMDQVSRQVTQVGSYGLQQLTATFGSAILTSHHELDRKALAKLCFASPMHTATLNGILHPLIWEASHAWQEQQKGDWVLFEIPLLIESNSLYRVDQVVMVIANLKTRRQRVLARGFQDETAFEAILKHQCQDEQRIQAADFIIDNDGYSHMHEQCDALLSHLRNDNL